MLVFAKPGTAVRREGVPRCKGPAFDRKPAVLDLLRLFGALLVVAGHVGELHHIPLPDIVARSTKEGVAIFFALPGFVVAHVASSKERERRSFGRARVCACTRWCRSR